MTSTPEPPSESFVIIAAVPNLKKEGGLAYLVNDPGYKVIYTATAAALYEQIAIQNADLVLVELGMPGIEPLDLMMRVRGKDPETPVMVMRMHDNEEANDDLIWNAGIDDGIYLPVSAVEVRHRVARSLKLRQLGKLYQQLKRENRSLWELSITDGLTRLINRRYFNEILELEFSRAQRFGGTLSCMMVDIDFFKKINDSHGHLAGDLVLQKLAAIVQQNVRSIDIAARYGGEEFVLLLPETGREGLQVVAEKLRSAVESASFVNSDHPELTYPERVTVSIGAANMPASKPDSAKGLVNLADTALYEAKRTGRNRVVYK